MTKLRAYSPEMWSAVTCHRFDRLGDSSPEQSRVQRLVVSSGRSSDFHGDKSPAESADKSAHSKARRRRTGRALRFHSS